MCGPDSAGLTGLFCSYSGAFLAIQGENLGSIICLPSGALCLRTEWIDFHVKMSFKNFSAGELAGQLNVRTALVEDPKFCSQHPSWWFSTPAPGDPRPEAFEGIFTQVYRPLH